MSKTRQRLVTVFAVIGVISTVLVLLSVVAAMTCSCAAKERVPRRTVLELHLDQTLAADGVDDPLSSLLGAQGTTLQQVIEALERGAHDDRVVGLVAYVDGTGQGMANVEELRDAVIAFRAAGKPAVAFAETFGELGSGTQGYFLATAFDEIYLQPSGTLGLTGLRVEKMYLRGALDKLDVEPQLGRRHHPQPRCRQLNRQWDPIQPSHDIGNIGHRRRLPGRRPAPGAPRRPCTPDTR